MIGEMSKQNLDSLDTQDILAIGVAAFNAQKYDEAIGILRPLATRATAMATPPKPVALPAAELLDGWQPAPLSIGVGRPATAATCGSLWTSAAACAVTFWFMSNRHGVLSNAFSR